MSLYIGKDRSSKALMHITKGHTDKNLMLEPNENTIFHSDLNNLWVRFHQAEFVGVYTSTARGACAGMTYPATDYIYMYRIPSALQPYINSSTSQFQVCVDWVSGTSGGYQPTPGYTVHELEGYTSPQSYLNSLSTCVDKKYSLPYREGGVYFYGYYTQPGESVVVNSVQILEWCFTSNNEYVQHPLKGNREVFIDRDQFRIGNLDLKNYKYLSKTPLNPTDKRINLGGLMGTPSVFYVVNDNPSGSGVVLDTDKSLVTLGNNKLFDLDHPVKHIVSTHQITLIGPSLTQGYYGSVYVGYGSYYPLNIKNNGMLFMQIDDSWWTVGVYPYRLFTMSDYPADFEIVSKDYRSGGILFKLSLEVTTDTYGHLSGRVKVQVYGRISSHTPFLNIRTINIAN